jgi:hypothetical protein
VSAAAKSAAFCAVLSKTHAITVPIATAVVTTSVVFTTAETPTVIVTGARSPAGGGRPSSFCLSYTRSARSKRSTKRCITAATWSISSPRAELTLNIPPSESHQGPVCRRLRKTRRRKITTIPAAIRDLTSAECRKNTEHATNRLPGNTTRLSSKLLSADRPRRRPRATTVHAITSPAEPKRTIGKILSTSLYRVCRDRFTRFKRVARLVHELAHVRLLVLHREMYPFLLQPHRRRCHTVQAEYFPDTRFSGGDGRSAGQRHLLGRV